jgi:hypothetical protein
VPKYSRRHLVNQAKKLVPSLSQKDFDKKGKIGVRAQLFDKKEKKLELLCPVLAASTKGEINYTKLYVCQE